ncbi:MAG: hypothetical protein VCB80_04070 [Deltaproteobacteria bacterium]
MADATKRLLKLLGTDRPDPALIAEHLDGLGTAEAIAAVRALSGRRLQKRLWTASAANPRITTADLVPPDYAPMRPVVFHGKNSLPLFTEFEKICCRPPNGATSGELWGYNEGPTRSWIGPGYYITHDSPGAELGGTVFDYTRIPERGCPGWPEPRPNERGVSRLVYSGMLDYMRRVAANVFIGSATKKDREMDSYFAVVRESI